MFAENKEFFEPPASFFVEAPIVEKVPEARTSGLSFRLRATGAALCVAANFLISIPTAPTPADSHLATPTSVAKHVSFQGPPKAPLRLVRDARVIERFSQEAEVDQLKDPDFGI